jgi:diaminopimelate epimerase
MRMWNADGSESGMCGNALRCIARYVYERGLTRQVELTIETGAGLIRATLLLDPDGSVRAVRTDLGRPALARGEVPMRGEPAGGRVIGERLVVDGAELTVSALSMGNPHLVIEVGDVEAAPVSVLGPRLEKDPRFPSRTNVGFVEVAAPDHLKLRVWERGSGETLACGSGAATVAMILRGRARPPLRVDLPGGRLVTHYQEGEGVVIEGPARFVFDGVYSPR